MCRIHRVGRRDPKSSPIALVNLRASLNPNPRYKQYKQCTKYTKSCTKPKQIRETQELRATPGRAEAAAEKMAARSSSFNASDLLRRGFRRQGPAGQAHPLHLEFSDLRELAPNMTAKSFHDSKLEDQKLVHAKGSGFSCPCS